MGDPGPTLFELAGDLAGLGCEEALNLDGGPLHGVGGAPRGEVSRSSCRARSVRHAVVVRGARSGARDDQCRARCLALACRRRFSRTGLSPIRARNSGTSACRPWPDENSSAVIS